MSRFVQRGSVFNHLALRLHVRDREFGYAIAWVIRSHGGSRSAYAIG
ncbi:MAG: hypothetical protein M3137_01060 [Actinomycetota bacterium]|nr:hypothetical protein [Actinomycetota bacterium]